MSSAGAAEALVCAERWPRVAVVLPGSGSDATFVRAAFEPALRAVGIALVAPDPRPGPDVVAGYREALDAAADGRPLLVGGISLGAQVAASWAAAQPPSTRPAGLLLALPAWTGAPAGAPAALAARLSAARLRAHGLGPELAAVRAAAPGWLADELARAWAGYGPALPDTLDAAAATPGPAEADLAGLDLPAGLAAVRDDPVHPVAVARRWRALLPRATLVEAGLDAFGADPATLGRAAVLGWLRSTARGPAGGSAEPPLAEPAGTSPLRSGHVPAANPRWRD